MKEYVRELLTNDVALPNWATEQAEYARDLLMNDVTLANWVTDQAEKDLGHVLQTLGVDRSALPEQVIAEMLCQYQVQRWTKLFKAM